MNPWPLARSQCFSKSVTGPIKVSIYESVLTDDETIIEKTPGTITTVSKLDIRVVCGDGRQVTLKTIQTEGRKPLNAGEWARGMRVNARDFFEDETPETEF